MSLECPNPTCLLVISPRRETYTVRQGKHISLATEFHPPSFHTSSPGQFAAPHIYLFRMHIYFLIVMAAGNMMIHYLELELA